MLIGSFQGARVVASLRKRSEVRLPGVKYGLRAVLS